MPTSVYSSRFITYAPSFIFSGKLFLETTPLNLGSFYNILYFKICLIDEAALKLSFLCEAEDEGRPELALTIPYPFLFPEPALTIPFPVNKFSNRLAPKVPHNILENPPFCSFVSFLIV